MKNLKTKHDNEPSYVNVIPLKKLDQDLKKAASELTREEVRFLVDNYYIMQDARIRCAGQVRSMARDGEPVALLAWAGEQNEMLENQIKLALKKYAESQPIGQWLLSICGIGPVIAAGLIAHIDIHKAETAGHIWRFAGLDPTVEWKKGEKRPHNAKLKSLVAYKLGESFVKVSGNDNAFYGKMYRARKDLEIARNERGEFAEQAAMALQKKKYRKTTEAYKCYIEGKLPPAHIHRRAVRYTVKIFLSHLFEKWREVERLAVPRPFAIAILEHAHEIKAPN